MSHTNSLRPDEKLAKELRTWLDDSLVNQIMEEYDKAHTPAPQGEGPTTEVRTLQCRCGWKGEPEETDPTHDESGIQCPNCGSAMLMELPDIEPGEGPTAPAPALDLAKLRLFMSVVAREKDAPQIEEEDVIDAADEWIRVIDAAPSQSEGSPAPCQDCLTAPDSMLGRLCDAHYIAAQERGEA